MTTCSDWQNQSEQSCPKTTPSGLNPLKADFAQVWSKLHDCILKCIPAENNIHLVDNLLLPLMFLSQLYKLIPESHIFSEKKNQTTL